MFGSFARLSTILNRLSPLSSKASNIVKTFKTSTKSPWTIKKGAIITLATVATGSVAITSTIFCDEGSNASLPQSTTDASSVTVAPFTSSSLTTVATAAPSMPYFKKQKIVVLGTGWGALSFIKSLSQEILDIFDVIIVSPRNYFLFTPLLPSCTVGTLAQDSVVEPIRHWLRKGKMIFYEAAAIDVDVDRRIVICQDDSDVKLTHNTFEINYDYLIVAVGSTVNDMGVPGVKQHCLFLKELPDCRKLRTRILDNFETASLPSSSEKDKESLLSFCVCGGGPTGTEFAAELHDYIEEDLKKVFPELCEKYSKIILVQSGDRVLNMYDKSISDYAEKAFSRSGIHIVKNARVIECKPDAIIVLDKGSKTPREIPSGLTLWATGVGTTPVVDAIRKRLPDDQKNCRGLVVDTRLRVVGGSDRIYALGDCNVVQTPQFRQNLVRLFKEADTDESGTISLDEIKVLLNKYVETFPCLEGFQEKISESFAKYDVDHSGSLDFEEWTELLKSAERSLRPLPATAQVAEQQGEYLSHFFNHAAKHRREGSPTLDLSEVHCHEKVFKYKHGGSLIYFGGDTAGFDMTGVPIPSRLQGALSGFAAFIAWRGAYLTFQFSTRARVSMIIDWIRTWVAGRDISRD